MNPRIASELALLRQQYADVDHKIANNMHWFRVGNLKTPDEPGKWVPNRIAAVFAVTEGYPGAQPYGFFVPAELHLNDQAPSGNPAPNPPPFEGSWRFLSWSPEGWQPAADVSTGSNLWGWVRSFTHRLREGI